MVRPEYSSPADGQAKLRQPYRLRAAASVGERSFFLSLHQAAEALWASRYYNALLLTAAALLLFMGLPQEGCLMLGLVGAFMLAFCGDLMAVLLPLLLYTLLSTGFFGNIDAYFTQWPVYAAAAGALCYHLRRYPAETGCEMRLTPSLLAVSAATALGGLGSISLREYFSPVALYYTLGLGVGMLLAYRLFRSRLTRQRSYNVLRRFLELMYTAGIFTGLVVLEAYLEQLPLFLRSFSVLSLPYRNLCAMFLLMALPTACLPNPSGSVRWGGLAFQYGALLLTGSRSALLFGTLLLFASLIYLYVSHPAWRRKFRVLALILGIPAAAALALSVPVLFSSRMEDGVLISTQDSRVSFFLQAIADFVDNPLFGRGIGYMGNSDIFLLNEGSIVWYHNLAAQVVGSMGALGVAAYGWHYYERLRLLLTKRSAELPIAAMCFGGMLLISMTNPGEFCPAPNELIIVALFAILEGLPDRAAKKSDAL